MDSSEAWEGDDKVAGTGFLVAEGLKRTCAREPARMEWLERLPALVHGLVERWDLTLGPLIGEEDTTCSYVAAVTCADGTSAVLKVGMPHMEGEHEIAALRFWDGDGAVRLLAEDEANGAMLLERCVPGTPLRTLPEPEQDVVIAGLLRRLWRKPAEPHPFRPLAVMTEAWTNETLANQAAWRDPGLVREGLRLFAELPRSAPEEVLLATDLHAGNVLQAEREPWLVIDPKPFVGDPAYDATQHLFDCLPRVIRDPFGVIQRFADLLEVDAERVRLWMFARTAAETADDWPTDPLPLARMLAP